MALKDNLVSYWKLNGNSLDSRSLNNGSDTSITYNAGKLGDSALFNATSDQILVADSSSLDATSLSLSFWIKTTDNGVNKNVISRYTSGTAGQRMFRGFLNSGSNTGKIGFYPYDSANNNCGTTAGSSDINDGNWHHVVLTIDNNGADLVMTVYTDGSATYGPTVQTGTTTAIATGTSAIQIGGSNTVETSGFLGDLDEIGMWSRALTSGEVTELYNAGAGITYDDFAGLTTKVATVASGDVPATQTNFPAYVDLSRLGITTLAEAQSVRVYADADKTTEWAREIVSATEMHVKIPSLTSTTSIYVDWDGSRADYAVTDTYGRNAVWSSVYDIVHHFENTTVNSVNGASPSANTFSYDSTSKLNTGITQTDGTARGFDWGTSYSMNTTTMSASAWFNNNESYAQENSSLPLFVYTNPASPYNRFTLDMVMGTVLGDRGKIRAYLVNSTPTSYFYTTTSAYNDGLWHLATVTYNGSTLALYIDGSLAGSVSASGTPGAGYKTTIGTNWDETTGHYVDDYDEVRATDSVALSANWITTEYNNQSDEAGFWGTWSDVGGGANTTNFFLMM